MADCLPRLGSTRAEALSLCARLSAGIHPRPRTEVRGFHRDLSGCFENLCGPRSDVEQPRLIVADLGIWVGAEKLQIFRLRSQPRTFALLVHSILNLPQDKSAARDD